MSEGMSTGLRRHEREQNYGRDLYNSRVPRECHPNLNAPAVQSNEYIPDSDWESHHIPHSDNPRMFRPLPDSVPVEKPITYEKSKTMSEFSLKAMEDQYQRGGMFMENDQDNVSFEPTTHTPGSIMESNGHIDSKVPEEINQTID